MDPTDGSNESDEPSHWEGLRTRSGMSFRERLGAPDAYGILLVLIILSLVVAAVLGDTAAGPGLVVLVEGGVVLFALRTSRSGRHVFRVALVGVPIVVVVAALLSGRTSDLAGGIVSWASAALCLAAIGAIVRRLAAHPRVDGVTILGALSAYLLIGSFFASVYAGVGAFSEQPFFASGSEADPVDYYYFSYVTLTTTGYGDFTAGTDLGRMLAVTEALLGQLYLVSVVALVIGNIGRQRRQV
jgi:hypothetical protein